MKLVIMGVSGCGKSSFGAALADRLQIGFRDADDLHPAANREKMAAGLPLTDADRLPWLQQVGATLNRADALVVACSALRRSYRDLLQDATQGQVRFLHLTAPKAVIAARLAKRQGHFMPPALLDSQLATLEPLSPDENGMVLDISGSLDKTLGVALAALGDPSLTRA